MLFDLHALLSTRPNLVEQRALLYVLGGPRYRQLFRYNVDGKRF
jgi:hypothetical protein